LGRWKTRKKMKARQSQTTTDGFATSGPIRVRLEWFEVSRAALVGVSRNVEALRKGLENSRPTRDSEWHVHILGALGECAFAKATGRYWSGSVNTFKTGGDVGAIQVRTRSQHDYDLLVRDDDADGDIFVLVTGGPNDFLVHGWMRGRDAKDARFRRNYGGYGEAYFVPKAKLSAIGPLVCGEQEEVA
jgi:hypothetical protein